MPAITSANVAQAILKLVASETLAPVEGNLVMGSLVNRNYESTLAHAGDTVNIPIPPTMTRTNIAEGGSVTTQAPSLGNAQVVLNNHAEVTFSIPDVTAALTGVERGDYSLLRSYLEPAAIALAEGIESDLCALYTNLSVNTAVGTGATALTENTIDLAEKVLFDAKVPENRPKVLLVSSGGYSDLRQISRFSEVRTNNDGTAIAAGRIGTIKGFNVHRSQFVAKPSSTTYNLAFDKDAFALVMRKLPGPLPGTGALVEYIERGNFGMRIVMSYAPNSLGMQFTVDCLYGVAILRNAFGVQVLS